MLTHETKKYMWIRGLVINGESQMSDVQITQNY